MLGNLKNSLAGTYHAIRDKHVPRYLEQFLDEHRATYGVEPICKVLPIAPSTYHAHIPVTMPNRPNASFVLTYRSSEV
jgi:hypothetical protein